MRQLFLFFVGVLCLVAVAGCAGANEVVISARWLPKSGGGLPALRVSIENRSDKAVAVPTYEGKPMVLLDYWDDVEGLVLVDVHQYRVLLGAFVVLKEISVAPAETASFEFELKDFVARGGETAGTRDWQGDFANAQRVRVIARLKVGDTELHSDYAYLNASDQDLAH